MCRHPCAQISARFQVTTAANQKLAITTMRGYRRIAITTRITASIFEIISAGTRPTRIRREMKRLASLAPR